MSFGRGVAILLTNDANYYNPPKRNIKPTRDKYFRLHQGHTINEVKWKYSKSTDDGYWTKEKYPYNVKPFHLPDNFKTDWLVYAGNDTKYLLNTVEP